MGARSAFDAVPIVIRSRQNHTSAAVFSPQHGDLPTIVQQRIHVGSPAIEHHVAVHKVVGDPIGESRHRVHKHPWRAPGCRRRCHRPIVAHAVRVFMPETATGIHKRGHLRVPIQIQRFRVPLYDDHVIGHQRGQRHGIEVGFRHVFIGAREIARSVCVQRCVLAARVSHRQNVDGQRRARPKE